MPFDLYPPQSSDTRRHLLSVTDLDRAAIERILDTAHGFESVMQRDVKKVPTLRGRTVMNLFFESSTRTSSSFELAAKRLSADTMSLKATGSSVDKGESLKDTVTTLSAYDPDVIVIRHPRIGAPRIITAYTDAHVVNAGDGKHQHPTQCLLDLYTIKRSLGKVDGLHVAIVGDVLHSRVARSNIQGLRMLGARVTVIGPTAADSARHQRAWESRSPTTSPTSPRPTWSTCCGCSASACRRAPTTSRRSPNTPLAGA